MAEKSKVCERIAEIDGCFGVSGQTLAVKGRVLIAEGVLTKSCRSGVKARQFFLFNDILVSPVPPLPHVMCPVCEGVREYPGPEHQVPSTARHPPGGGECEAAGGG